MAFDECKAARAQRVKERTERVIDEQRKVWWLGRELGLGFMEIEGGVTRRLRGDEASWDGKTRSYKCAKRGRGLRAQDSDI